MKKKIKLSKDPRESCLKLQTQPVTTQIARNTEMSNKFALNVLKVDAVGCLVTNQVHFVKFTLKPAHLRLMRPSKNTNIKFKFHFVAATSIMEYYFWKLLPNSL